MKYYNENTVKQIVKDAMNYGLTISQNIPMDINSYPSVDIKEPHGRLGDLDKLEATAKKYCQGCTTTYYDSGKCYDCWVGDMIELIHNQSTLIEST